VDLQGQPLYLLEWRPRWRSSPWTSQIDAIKHELDLQLRRIAQLQQQLDQLRAIVRQLPAPTPVET
jgi:hypothetical protein